MRQAKTLMGTGVTLDIVGAIDEEVFNLVFSRLEDIDARFSTYKKTSEASHFAAGDLTEGDLSAEFKKVLSACRQAEKDTGGLFSAWAGDAFDPSGYVKGWAIGEAAKLIRKQGFKTFCISIGGDILAAGDKDWRIGIQDPNDKDKILTQLSVKDGAVATSGIYARGTHIINPRTKKPAASLASVTIIGPSIIKADVFATAAYVAGASAAEFMDKWAAGYGALIIYMDGRQELAGRLSR